MQRQMRCGVRTVRASAPRLTDWLRPRRDLCAPANPSRPS